MGAIRVVLYAEGAGETRGELSLPLRPADTLIEEVLGPAHLLARRTLSAAKSIPENAIRFEQPLRTRRAQIAKGSMLHDAQTLKELLTWGAPQRRPDLAIVLVDCDGDAGRKTRLQAELGHLLVRNVIAVAVQEFESWLIADAAAVAAVLGPVAAHPAAVETLAPREAKRLLATWIDKRDGQRAQRSGAEL